MFLKYLKLLLCEKLLFWCFREVLKQNFKFQSGSRPKLAMETEYSCTSISRFGITHRLMLNFSNLEVTKERKNVV